LDDAEYPNQQNHPWNEEARMLSSRQGRGGVNLVPTGREVVSLERELQHVECLLRLAHEDVDASEDMMRVRPGREPLLIGTRARPRSPSRMASALRPI
jgi:hypothetical protein